MGRVDRFYTPDLLPFPIPPILSQRVPYSIVAKGRVQDLRARFGELKEREGGAPSSEGLQKTKEVLLFLANAFHSLAGSGTTHGFAASSRVAGSAESCILGHLEMEAELSGEALAKISAYIDELDRYRKIAV